MEEGKDCSPPILCGLGFDIKRKDIHGGINRNKDPDRVCGIDHPEQDLYQAEGGIEEI